MATAGSGPPSGDDWGVLPPSPPEAGRPGVPTVEPTPSPSPTTGSPWRDRFAVALAVLAVVALFWAHLAWWVSRDVYDTASVTTKAGLLIASPDTQAALTAVLEDKVVTPALEQAAGALPEPFQSLGGAVQSQTGGLVHDAISSAVASQTSSEVAMRLVAAVNPQLVDGSDPIVLTPTQLVGIVAPGLADNRVVSGLVDLAERSGCCTVVLADRADLPFVWQHVELIRFAAVALPVAALVLALGALLIARRRVRVALVLTAGTALGGAVVLLSLWAGIHWGVDLIGDSADRSTVLVRQAVRVTAAVTIGDLRRESWAILLVGSLATAGVLLGARVSRRASA
jgi:hypothetical protein